MPPLATQQRGLQTVHGPDSRGESPRIEGKAKSAKGSSAIALLPWTLVRSVFLMFSRWGEFWPTGNSLRSDAAGLRRGQKEGVLRYSKACFRLPKHGTPSKGVPDTAVDAAVTPVDDYHRGCCPATVAIPCPGGVVCPEPSL